MITLNLASDARFENDTVTNQNVVGNRFIELNSVTETDISGLTDIDAPLDVVLSRSDWTGTWPTPISDNDRNASTSLINEFRNVTTNNPNDYYDTEKYEYAIFDQLATIQVRDLLPTETPEESWLPFVDYDDERWQAILDATNAANLIEVYNQAAYQTKAIDNVGMPATLQADGPSGFTCFLNKEQISGTNQYASQPVFSSTWNVELIEELGKTIGE
jgi:beta-glucosidase